MISLISTFFSFCSYFNENRLTSVKNNLKDKKILLATFESDVTVENHYQQQQQEGGSSDILLNKIKVDISSGKGEGSSYQPDTEQLKKLVELCNTTVFGHGSVGDARNSKYFCFFQIFCVFSSSI